MAQSNRDNLIEAASDLFYAHGFHSIGVDRIIDEVGVTKTTFYNHFESKDDLIVAVLKRRDEIEMRELLREMQERGGDDPRARLLGLFDALDAWFHDDGFKGCIFVNAAVEFPSPHDPVHHAAAAHGANIYQEVLALAQQAGAERPEVLAGQLTMLVSGSLITRHVAHKLNAAMIAREVAVTLLDAELPSRANSGRGG